MATLYGDNDENTLVATEPSTLAGFAASDNLTGSDGDDRLFGGTTEWKALAGAFDGIVGAKYVYVGDNDSLIGRGGNDLLFAGTGTDLIDGGEGYDQANFWADGLGRFMVEESVGDNTSNKKFVQYQGILSNLVLNLAAQTYSAKYIGGLSGTEYGTASGTIRDIEEIIATNSGDQLIGSSRDETFKPLAGNDSIDGGGGWDILSFDDAGTKGVSVNWALKRASDSFGRVDRFSNIEHLIGSKNNDSIFGAGGNQTFTGAKGNDEINGGTGIDTIDYGAERGTAGVTVKLDGTSTDTFGNKDKLVAMENVRGTALADSISGDQYRNKLWGQGGNDKLFGLANDDRLYGGDGDDTLNGGDERDTQNGDAGKDLLDGGDQGDTLHGDTGNDTLKGGSGNDRLYGDADNDTLKGGQGDDLIEGGDGNDTIVDKEAASVSHESRAWSGNTISGGDGSDRLTVLGVVSGGEGDDVITGQGRLQGDAGNDTITATDYEEPHAFIQFTEMSGGDGNDLLTAKGNLVAPAASYDYSGTGIQAFLDSGIVQVTATDNDSLIGLTNIIGSRFDDTIFGSSDEDFVHGNDGNDTITGKGGEDRLDGQAGNDSIQGGAHDDVLFGGDGNDTLQGDAGYDTLEGEAGNDTFNLGGGVDRSAGGGGADIFLFVSAGSDASALGGKGNDTMIASHGGTMAARGDGGSDTFIVRTDADEMAIVDFKHDIDKVDVSDFGFSSFSALTKRARIITTVDGNLEGVVKLDSDTYLRLAGFDSMADFKASDFIL